MLLVLMDFGFSMIEHSLPYAKVLNKIQVCRHWNWEILPLCNMNNWFKWMQIKIQPEKYSLSSLKRSTSQRMMMTIYSFRSNRKKLSWIRILISCSRAIQGNLTNSRVGIMIYLVKMSCTIMIYHWLNNYRMITYRLQGRW